MADDAEGESAGAEMNPRGTWSPSQQRGLMWVLGGLLVFLTMGVVRDRWSMGRVEFERLPPRAWEYRLDLNRANKYELVQLPGIGPKLAEMIVQDRETQGPFESVEDLSRIRGIGDATLADLRPYLFVKDTSFPR
jgi:competence ComEA-like helix-hairpin-helix protein